jgi:hypothetical protein
MQDSSINKQHLEVNKRRSNSSWKFMSALTVIFVLINISLLMATIENGNLVPDSNTFVGFANALLEGGLSEIRGGLWDPESYRQPLYPIFLVASDLISGGRMVPTAIILQIIILFLTGCIAKLAVEEFLPDCGPLAFGLIIMNPNSIGNAHFIISGTFFSLFFVLAIWAGLKVIKLPRPGPAIALGCSLGFACLIRSDPKYLLLSLPVFLPLAALLCGRRSEASRFALYGSVALIVSGLILSPWIARNNFLGGGYTISMSNTEEAFLWKNVVVLSIQKAPNTKPVYVRRAKWAELNNFREKIESSSNAADKVLIKTKLRNFAINELLGFGAPSLIAAYSISQLKFLTSAGAKNFNLLFGMDSGVSVIFTSILSYGYLIVLRILGLIGIWALIARQQWMLLLVTTGVIAYFSTVHLFIGLSRYRLPIETLFVLLALFGLSWIYQQHQLRRGR